MQSLRDSLERRSLKTSEGRETQPENNFNELISREFLITTDAVDIVHAVFETGHAEGSNQTQVQLFEGNAKHIHWIGQEPGCETMEGGS
ncbi:hypothetical protein BPTFM16_01232 [Altererythrobacter insulae]|nr:hypothetical protein BPTFM16_01232 [Altererythrobacter insulae]